MKVTQPWARRTGAFTLIELLVVFAIIAILAALLLPTLARAKAKASETYYRNNCKELTVGVFLYCNDNIDVFPGCASGGDYGFDVSDWIYWRTNPPATLSNGVVAATLPLSPVIAEMGSRSNLNIVLCPMDVDDPARGVPNEGQVYPYSYQMTCLVNGLANQPVVVQQEMIIEPFGFMSIVDHVFNTGSYPFKTTSVRNPALKILCAEPVTHLEAWDAPADDLTGAFTVPKVAQDGRFEPVQTGVYDGAVTWCEPFNYLTCRHGSGRNSAGPQAGQANVSFGDGHVAMVPWTDGTNVACVDPSY